MPIHAPAYTQFPNEILEAIPELSESEFKVMAVLVRNTLGYHRQECSPTMDDLCKATGLSLNSIRSGIRGCMARQWIQKSNQKPFSYRIWLEDRGHHRAVGRNADFAPRQTNGWETEREESADFAHANFERANFDPSNFEPSMDQNLNHQGSKFAHCSVQNLRLSSNKGFKENSKEIASLSLKKADPEGEARENSLRSPEPDPTPDPAAQHPSSPVELTPASEPAQHSGVNVPPPAAPAHDPFARRGYPQVVPIRAQFEGPWGQGYTPELERFEAWLLEHKAKGKTNPSSWMAAVVDGIAKGGSRALWSEFERFERGEVEPAAPVRERSPAMKKFLGIA